MPWKTVWLIVGGIVIVLVVALHLLGGHFMHELFAPLHGGH
jgi:hypothetical protein